MEYRVGMKVKITNEFDYNDPIGVNCLMEEHKGKIATIVSKNEIDKYYTLNIDCGFSLWTDTMLSPLIMNKGKLKNHFLKEYVCYWKPT